MTQRRGRWAGYGDYRGVRNGRRSGSGIAVCSALVDEVRECMRPAVPGNAPRRCAAHVERIRFEQAEEWHRAFDGQTTGSVYADDRCCVCYRPTGPEAARIMLTRTNDGEWWAVHPLASVREDERHMGDPHFVLPIGFDCLRKHPEWQFAIRVEAAP